MFEAFTNVRYVLDGKVPSFDVGKREQSAQFLSQSACLVPHQRRTTACIRHNEQMLDYKAQINKRA